MRSRSGTIRKIASPSTACCRWRAFAAIDFELLGRGPA